jgi:hypothetical protein
MQFKKVTSLFEYAGWMLKKYQESQNTQQDVYRLVEIKHMQSSKCKLIIQVIGKCITFECAPKEIISDDKFLESFSKKDIKTITRIAYSENQKPEYKIIAQEFCETFNQMMFRLKSQDSDKWILKSAAEISLDKTLMSSLSWQDIQAISYIAGYEHSLNDKKEMRQAKKN